MGDDNSDYRSDDDFDMTSVDSEERKKAFYGEDYTLISQALETNQQ